MPFRVKRIGKNRYKLRQVFEPFSQPGLYG
jgi:hypothetical protein